MPSQVVVNTDAYIAVGWFVVPMRLAMVYEVVLLPPSIMLVVMGLILAVPVTHLFAAAIIPGILMALLYLGYA